MIETKKPRSFPWFFVSSRSAVSAMLLIDRLTVFQVDRECLVPFEFDHQPLFAFKTDLRPLIPVARRFGDPNVLLDLLGGQQIFEFVIRDDLSIFAVDDQRM